jgi:nicotinamidase-related amidase
MRYTLVVNDVQKAPEFIPAVTPALLEGVAAVITHALAQDNPIVFTEIPYWSIFEDAYPPTEECLTALVKGYERTMKVPKMVSDGSKNIQIFFGELLEPSCFVLVGINTDVCVLETAIGLHQRYPNATIIVVYDACNSVNTALAIKDAWAPFAEHPYIRVVQTAADIDSVLPVYSDEQAA